MEEWGKAQVGGEGDVQVGEEGVQLDEVRKGKKANAVVEEVVQMEMDA